MNEPPDQAIPAIDHRGDFLFQEAQEMKAAVIGGLVALAVSAGAASATTVAEYQKLDMAGKLGEVGKQFERLSVEPSESQLAIIMTCMNHAGEKTEDLVKPARLAIIKCMAAAAE